mmetsp:Transcript_19417/g.30818  ORF Transcript_19417/g.30818 Transcript_19417/m.30818 type:complete len:138 (+) Transcript_19417:718-1131(+)
MINPAEAIRMLSGTTSNQAGCSPALSIGFRRNLMTQLCNGSKKAELNLCIPAQAYTTASDPTHTRLNPSKLRALFSRQAKDGEDDDGETKKKANSSNRLAIIVRMISRRTFEWLASAGHDRRNMRSRGQKPRIVVTA